MKNNVITLVAAISFTFFTLVKAVKGSKVNCLRNCNIARIELNCKPGFAYCSYDDFEYCAACDNSSKIIAASSKNVYQCVQSENSLCRTGSCKICDQDGNCIQCPENKHSINGICQDEKKCDGMPYCISCNDQRECFRCTTEAALDPIKKSCVKDDSIPFCAEFKYDNNNNRFCNLCQLGKVMNYDFKGCRPK